MITPTFEDECEEEEDKEEEEKEDEFLTSDDSESSLQCEEDEELERDQRWEIVAKLPPVVACQQKNVFIFITGGVDECRAEKRQTEVKSRWIRQRYG